MKKNYEFLNWLLELICLLTIETRAGLWLFYHFSYFLVISSHSSRKHKAHDKAIKAFLFFQVISDVTGNCSQTGVVISIQHQGIHKYLHCSCHMEIGSNTIISDLSVAM